MATISVVIPSFQHAHFIEETLRSVLEQDFPADRLEVIVQDGGSTDGTVEILQRYSERITWTSGPDGGQSAAINTGLQKSAGDILCYLNSDDLLAAGTLQAVADYFETNPEVDLLYGKADIIDTSGVKIDTYPVEPWSYARLQETCFISQPAAFWRRRVHDRIGWFNESLHFSMDYDFWLRIGASGKVVYLPQLFALARRHGDAKTVKLRAASFEEAFKLILQHRGRPAPRRWILALAQARAEKHLANRRLHPLAWARFVGEYCRQARALQEEFGCAQPFRLTSSILPHCLSAWKKTGHRN